MNIVGVLLIASGLVLLVWLYGPVHSATLAAQQAPAAKGRLT